MATLKETLQKPSNIGDLINTLMSQPAPAVVPREQPGLATGSLGPAPAVFTTDYDRVRQWMRPGTSQNRFPPLPTKANPQLNAAASSVTKNVITQTVTPPAIDDDDIIVNPQTGVNYTVQQSDYNKLISIANAAGGTIFLPPVTGSVGVSVNNKSGTSPFLFNSGNTTFDMTGLTGTSTATVTVTGKDINAGDFLFLFIRNHGSPSPSGVSGVSMTDTINGPWSVIANVTLNDVGVSNDRISLFGIQVASTISVGTTFSVTTAATYVGVGQNPGENILWNMTGLKNLSQKVAASGLVTGGKFSSGGLTSSSASTFISCAENDNGALSTGIPEGSWTNILTSSNIVGVNFRSAILGNINDIYDNSSSGNFYGDLLTTFIELAPTDIAKLSGDFFCYIQNTGLGSYAVKSSINLDGSSSSITLTTGQGALFVYSPELNGWFTERGMSGGAVDVDFYQTVQQAGVNKTQENKLNFLGPITATDNAGNGSTDIAVPDVVGDSGSGGVHGLVPAPAAGDTAANKFLKASGSFATPPIMVGDSGSGGTAGYVPAAPAGSNAAGDFLSAGGSFVNPGTNPASFNTGLAYAIAAGYALG